MDEAIRATRTRPGSGIQWDAVVERHRRPDLGHLALDCGPGGPPYQRGSSAKFIIVFANRSTKLAGGHFDLGKSVLTELPSRNLKELIQVEFYDLAAPTIGSSAARRRSKAV